ncbi:helix-turn-helix domain-containing protein (plasmid) [Methylobacterium sp. NMS14P]|uniref:helix-turn-helix domain-containing protein n=1 Tax=Methylobacterium sp. NMS14P TaxID=2894310 RepID=UPI002359259A|nr:helix-turn-helix domain-containing protein [Methylobacterium sp. NMS14P]WCS28852.1 helix-turn-helix domain-containing protein [Methylobacterium sp. NMS14P]
MFADEIRRAIEAATRLTLPKVTALLWRAYGEGQITEGEAEELSVLIEGRTLSESSPRPGQSPNPTGTGAGEGTADPRKLLQAVRRAVGSRPRTDASMERRRRWAASGRLPPAIAARFTLAEQAVLSLVAAEVARRKDCRLSIENMAAVAGVCRSTVKNAIREARQLGLLTVEERQITGFRNDTNVIRILSPEWLAWIRLARKGDAARPTPAQGKGRHGPTSQGGGVKSVTSTPTKVPDLGKTRPAEPKEGCRGAAGDLDRSDHAKILTGGMAGSAMR